jgi:hypothetical protein
MHHPHDERVTDYKRLVQNPNANKEKIASRIELDAFKLARAASVLTAEAFASSFHALLVARAPSRSRASQATPLVERLCSQEACLAVAQQQASVVGKRTKRN